MARGYIQGMRETSRHGAAIQVCEIILTHEAREMLSGRKVSGQNKAAENKMSDRTTRIWEALFFASMLFVIGAALVSAVALVVVTAAE